MSAPQEYNGDNMSEQQSPEGKSEPNFQRKPEFDGGSFVIEYLSTSPNGFEIKTGKTSRRREAGVPIPLDQNQRNRLKIAMADQIKFAEGNKAKASLDNLRHAQTEEEKIAAAEDFEKKRQIYKERSVPTIGLRAIVIEGNTVIIDIKPIDFPTYREFSKPEASTELLDFSSAAAASTIVITKDNRLILQHRSVRNKLYGGIPGASVGGYLKGHFDPAREGRFVPIDTEYIKDDAAREAKEELGLDRKDFITLNIAGIAHEKTQIHDEILLFGQVNLTASEMKEKAIKTSRNSKISEEEFYEKFLDIPATPNAIRTLLTEVKCPLPPTHIAAFVTAGYYMMLEQSGIKSAQEWKNNLQESIKKNYKDIAEIVKNYYEKNPKAFSEIPERYKNSNIPNRSRNGYDPEFLPEEQGLPDLISELKRVKLITDNNDEALQNNEVMKTVDHMLILDVDGVISDLKDKKAKPEVLQHIANELKSGKPVALNTGRSTEWVLERTLQSFVNDPETRKYLKNLIIVGEKGGTWMDFDENGRPQDHIDESISIPQDLQDDVRDLVNSKYSGSTFFDSTKRTMISTEMRDGYDMASYDEDQKLLAPQVGELIRKYGLENVLVAEPNPIAYDIQNIEVGKHLGVKRILNWLKDKSTKIVRFTTIGDSQGDIKMAQELNKNNLKVKHVHVGKKGTHEESYPFEVITTEREYEEGTEDFLKGLPKEK